METDFIKEQLKLLAGTRLLADTMPELGKHIGQDLKSSGNLYKLGGQNAFRREAVYHQLCFEVDRDYDIDLDQLLDDYRQVSATFKEKRLRLLKAPIVPRPEQVDEVLNLLEPFDEDDQYERSIALMLYYGLLPMATANAGDAQDVKESLYLLADILTAIAQVRPMISFSSLQNLYLERYESKKDKDGNEIKVEVHRIDLIWLAHEMLTYFYDCDSDTGRYAMAMRRQRRLLSFDLDGIWLDADHENTVFWQVEEMQNAYRFRRCQFSDGDRTIHYTDYTCTILLVNGEPCMEVFHPHFFIDFLEQGKVDGKHDALYDLDLDHLDKPQELTLDDWHVEDHFFDGSHLRKAVHAEPYEQRLERYDLTDDYPDCHNEIHYDIAAITPDAIYVKRSLGGYYRVPRDLRPGMELIDVDDLVGEITVKGHCYLAFDNLLYYQNVDDEGALGKLGITICQKISFAES